MEQEYQRRLSGESSAKEHKGKEQLEGLLQKVKRGIARLIDAYSEGLLDKSEFEPRVRRAKERLAELEKQAKVQADLEEQQRELRLVIGRLQEFAERVREGLNGADWSTRREIIRTLVKRVEIGDDDVRVIYRVDVSPFVEGPEGGRLPYCWRSPGPQLGEPLSQAPRLASPSPVPRPQPPLGRMGNGWHGSRHPRPSRAIRMGSISRSPRREKIGTCVFH